MFTFASWIDIVLNGVFGHQDVRELTYQNLHFSHVRRNYVLKRINSFRSALIKRYRYQLLSKRINSSIHGRVYLVQGSAINLENLRFIRSGTNLETFDWSI